MTLLAALHVSMLLNFMLFLKNPWCPKQLKEHDGQKRIDCAGKLLRHDEGSN